MFIDKAQVEIKAGNGGNGFVSFRHEKFVDRGGPDGGDGGDGGDVVFVASRNQNTLANFRFQKLIEAEHGQRGDKQRKHGKSAQDTIVPVPVGTLVIDEHEQVLADLHEDGQKAIIAHGGKGGFGNAHFVSSVRQAPKVAEKGEAGQALTAVLELKMIADVGLVGLPNAGKSTLLSVISNARPEIADYPFTTLTPNLGVVDIDGSTSMLFADIPGLIEGASEGKGLGDDFLRHVERTSVLLHLVDAYQDNIEEAYTTIMNELKQYRTDLTDRPQVVVLTKTEGLDQEMITDRLSQLQPLVPAETPLMAISSKSGAGIKELLYEVKNLVQSEKLRKEKEAEEANPDEGVPLYTLDPSQTPWRVLKEDDHLYLVTGFRIEKFAGRTDFDNEEGVRRLRDIMKRMFIIRELERQGAKHGDTILLGRHGSFEL